MKRAWGESLCGMVFGRLSVVAEAERKKDRRQWLCECACGTRKVIGHRALKSGMAASCGCLRKEVAAKRKTVHGYACRGKKSRLYKVWTGMLARCQIKSASGYENYGGRGIGVCERWHEFENFLADMGEPASGMTIERNDNNGNYEPGNCRWATRKEQGKNKRNNRVIEHAGKSMTVTDWARHLGISLATLLEALEKHPLDVALRSRQ
jgi:hypothetical protein